MFQNNFNIFYNLIRYFIRVFLLLMVTLLLFRFAFLFGYGNKAELTNYIPDVLRAFVVGLRFDIMVTSYAMSLPFLLIVAILFVPNKYTTYQNFVKKFIFYYSLFISIAFIIISLIDFYFYKFFQFHINILFFGIANDDTINVLRSVWSDYPLIRILLFILITVFIYWFILKKIVKVNHNNPINKPIYKTILVFSLLLFYCGGMRGSFGLFPLCNENSIISDNSFINTLTINGVFSLKDAISEKSNQIIDTDTQKKLMENGFISINDAISVYLDKKVTDNKDVEKQLIAQTKQDDFLQQNPPNVIFIQMESFGNYYLDLHTPTLNLLGELEPQLKDCILFRNFLSGTHGTIGSLEGFLVNTPITPISQSTYMDCSLTSSAAMPYKKAGYHTSFVTGADLGWRNLDKFVPKQYFETVEGSEILLKKVDNASRNEWGVYDEFIFDRMLQIIQNANNKPQFIFAMTTTNHTPFVLPSHYKRYPINLTEDIRGRLRTNEDIAVKNFTNYQYANDCLGRFIEKIKKSPLGKNTIIAASGDHNTLQLFNYSDSHLLQKFSVPFLLYVPKKYLAHSTIDTSRFGSHKDIFPTLFNLSLSNASYLKSGINMLDTVGKDRNFAIINYDVAMNKKGCVDASGSKPLFYKWTSANSKTLQATNLKQSPELRRLLKQAKAYKASMTYYIQTDLKKLKK